MATSPARLRELDRRASQQHGLVVRDQILTLLGSSGIDRWLDSGRLDVMHPGVYRLAGSPPTTEQAILAAVLGAGAGALASHRAATWLWRLLPERVGKPEPEITVPTPRRPQLAGVIVHRSLDLRAERPAWHRSIPLTNPLLTVLHLGAVVGAEVLHDAVEEGVRRRLFTIAGLDAVHDRFGRCGRNGAGALRQLIDERALGAKPADGLLEPRMARLLRRYELPSAAYQYEVELEGSTYFIDFAYPRVKLAIEVDGYEQHSSPRAMQRDLERQNNLVAAGWTVLRFTWRDVVRRPADVARRIRQQLAALGA
jgi:very-short-patch-repair endonuclease